MISYKIDISSGERMFTLSPEGPLRLLSGGLLGFDGTEFDVVTGAYGDESGGYVKKRRFGVRAMGILFEITENDGMWRRQIGSVVNPTADCTLSLTMDGVSRQITGIPSEGIRFHRDNPFEPTVAELHFVAPEPFLMGAETTRLAFEEKRPLLTFPMNFYPNGAMAAGYTVRTDRGIAVNQGDTPCGVRLTIRAVGGSVSSPMVSCGAEYVKVNLTLAEGDELVIDTRRRRKGVWLNGERTLAFDWTSTFFALPVGESELKIHASAGKEHMEAYCDYVPLYFGM